MSEELLNYSFDQEDDQNNNSCMMQSQQEEAIEILEFRDMISVMRQQESSHEYSCRDYLGKNNNNSHSNSTAVVDQASRQQICEWMYVVVDHFGVSRNVVGNAIALLDLYFSSTTPTSRQNFKLMAMACLFVSMKLQGHAESTVSIQLQTLVKLSRGLFTVQQVQEAEMRLLFALKWKIHPPTRHEFLQAFLKLLPTSLKSQSRYKVTEVARFLVEMSQCVYKFSVQHKPSAIAYASILIAMDDVVDGHCISIQQIQSFTRDMSSIAGLDHTSDEVAKVAADLQQLLLDQDTDIKTLMESLEDYHPHNDDAMDEQLVAEEEQPQQLRRKRDLLRQANSSSPRDVMDRKVGAC